MSSHDENNVPALVSQLNDSRRGIARLAANYLMLTPQGRSELKKLYQENPARIKTIFTIIPDECIDREQKNIRWKFSKYYLRIAQPCPICDTPPENLTWLYVDIKPGDCSNRPYADYQDWISICDKCSLQIDRFNIWDTPPEVQSTPELDPYFRILRDANSTPEDIDTATRALVEHGDDGLARLISTLNAIEPNEAQSVIDAVLDFGEKCIKPLIDKLDDSNQRYKLNLIQVFSRLTYVEGLTKISGCDDPFVREAANEQLNKLNEN